MPELRQTEDLEPWVRRIITATIMKHQIECPVPKRLAELEVRTGFLIGYMIGSGIIGGFGGALIIKALL
ncbi:MAG: hypothetical protein JRE40_13545 [Deltaproteobacteria bacterium]|nr:hypothetical protein [Deltaproteobacteria bacterium]